MLVLLSMYTITDSQPFHLDCHSQNPSSSTREINVRVEELASGGLMLNFSLVGDVSILSIPELRSSRRADNLWMHTCFEAFVIAGEGPEYLELNFSPSGEWAVYAFRGYRDGVALDNELVPAISVRHSMDRLELDAEITPDILPSDGPLRLGLSAVVEDADGRLSYWALRHAPGKPDFHHPDAFALQLGAVCVT